MKILIVDDSKAMRMIVTRTLRQAGYGDHTFVEAVDGADGFVCTVDWSGSPVVRERMHWVAAEATATAAALHAATGEPEYDAWYRTWWQHVADHFRDTEHGSWHHELATDLTPSTVTWAGKPDTYHAFQATLIPRLPLAPTLAAALRDGLLA